MKVVFWNEFGRDAEEEIIRRFDIAGTRLGWSIYKCSSVLEIENIRPDFVIFINKKSFKNSKYTTYQVGNLPISHYGFEEIFEDGNSEINLKILCSIDAVLTQPGVVNRWLKEVQDRLGKEDFIFDKYYSSCYATEFKKPTLDNARLAYMGINWDGSRFKSFFKELAARAEFVDFYGRKSGFEYLGERFLGPVPFDGKSTIEVYKSAQVGLCLHRQEFIDDDMPTNRIFEITAASAVAITDRVPFIERNYKDSVLYIDRYMDNKSIVADVIDKFSWICSHPEAAAEMARHAHNVFLEKFTLEGVLNNLQSFHKKRQLKVLDNKSSDFFLVELILDLSKENLGKSVKKDFLSKVEKLLNSIKAQNYDKILLTIICDKILKVQINSILEKSPVDFDIQYITENPAVDDDTKGILPDRCKGDAVSIIDLETYLFPNHIKDLCKNLFKDHLTDYVYSGCLEKSEKIIVNDTEKEFENITLDINSKNIDQTIKLRNIGQIRKDIPLDFQTIYPTTIIFNNNHLKLASEKENLKIPFERKEFLSFLSRLKGKFIPSVTAEVFVQSNFLRFEKNATDLTQISAKRSLRLINDIIGKSN